MVWAFKNVFCNFDWALVKKNVDFLFYPKTAILTYGSKGKKTTSFLIKLKYKIQCAYIIKSYK